MIPILELREGLLAASLLKVSAAKAIPICIMGNIIPIPFILLFIRQIFKLMKKTKVFRGLIERLENRAMGKSDQIKNDTDSSDYFCLPEYRFREQCMDGFSDCFFWKSTSRNHLLQFCVD